MRIAVHLKDLQYDCSTCATDSFLGSADQCRCGALLLDHDLLGRERLARQDADVGLLTGQQRLNGAENMV